MGDDERGAGDDCPPGFRDLRQAVATFATRIGAEVRMVKVPHTQRTWDLFFSKPGLSFHEAQGIAHEMRCITTRTATTACVLRIYTSANPKVWARGTAYGSAVRLCPKCGADTMLCTACYMREGGEPPARAYPGSFCPACEADRCGVVAAGDA